LRFYINTVYFFVDFCYNANNLWQYGGCMQEVSLTIWTTVDQEVSRFSCKAEMEVLPLSAVLRYKERDAAVCIQVKREEVLIERQGDYCMRLCLREGCRTQGALSIAGNKGALEVSTQRIESTITPNMLLLSLEYTLHFGEEMQKMSLRIKSAVAK
jgi:uncharacterized beta-barrel protein YwiB (DUF1934 family)